MRVPRIIIPATSQFRLYGKTDPKYGVAVGRFQPGMYMDLAAEAPAHRWDLLVVAAGTSGGTQASDWILKLRQHTIIDHTSGPMFSTPYMVPFDEARTKADILEGEGWYGPGMTPPAHAGEFGVIAQGSVSPNFGHRTLVSRVIRNTGRTKLEYDLEFIGGSNTFLSVAMTLTPVFDV